MDQEAIIQYVTDTFSTLHLSRAMFIQLFGHPPTEAATTSAGYDFAALDRLIPHPVYAPQSWMSVHNPSAETFETLKPLLLEAYSAQRASVERRASAS
jgi:uncharacterized protein DUF6194